MSKKKKIKPSGNKPESNPSKSKATKEKKQNLIPWIIPIIVITAIAFAPMLQNGFTNWDDEYYVIQNGLLRGPDWAGIFSKPVVSNYHPITIMTLALNYKISQLDPTSYIVLNLLLHLVNTGLVFYFIWLISGKNLWVAAFTALVFGIHPMHVESVSWISERKDVLYTLFFLLSLIKYWRFLGNKQTKDLIYCFLFFALSILSKPAAIILPFILLILDYWYGRKFEKKIFTEKIPFLLLAIAFAIITVKLQSRTAIASLSFYPLWARFFFATYTSMTYMVRFFVPHPMAAFHPFPSPDNLGLPVLLSPVFMAALLALIWIKRKNKLVVFSFFFFMINLILVLQLISIGGTLFSERYTYVPYIGMAFLIAMLLDKYVTPAYRSLTGGLAAAVLLFFCVLTFQRTKVWRNSDTLWTDTIKEYPDAPVPRTNRANYLIREYSKPENANKKDSILQRALNDCNEALRVSINHAKGYENRLNIYILLNKDSLALADANSLIKYDPQNKLGYYGKGVALQRLQQPDSALAYFDRSIMMSPNTDFALNSRGSLLYNYYKRYKEAMADFTAAIQINPNAGDYYLNRSFCHYSLGEIPLAQADARKAMELGKQIADNYRKMINL